ncbi:MAG: NTP transferase domain-containing protein [Burkholderiales bacterium]
MILAAGTGSRFGGQKLLALLDGRPLIAHVVAAVAHLPTVVVGPPELEPHIYPARLIENLAPERGMSHSLRLANAAIDADDALLVLLGDMPYVTRGLIDGIIAMGQTYDVAYPARKGVGGHPVLFSSTARSRIDALENGDTIKHMRDDPMLSSVRLPIDGPEAYLDIDTPEDLRCEP